MTKPNSTKVWLLIGLMLSMMQGSALAESPRVVYLGGEYVQKMTMAILGEAEGESYQGKIALAYALINRGTMRGVYGYKAISVRSGAYYRGDRRLSDRVVEQARKALKWAILCPEADITHGATHWENVKAFGEPYWAKGKQPTLVIGSHAFYSEIK